MRAPGPPKNPRSRRFWSYRIRNSQAICCTVNCPSRPRLPVSFTAYSATLRAEPELRRRVLASGAAFAVTGVVVASAMPGGFWFIAPAVLTWSAWIGAELTLAHCAYRSSRAFTLLADGSVEVELADGSRRIGQVAPGGLRWGRWAWLRVRLAGRPSWGEPLSLGGQDREQWRRFQVISRHMSA